MRPRRDGFLADTEPVRALSVIMASHNGQATLPRVLEALGDCDMTDLDVEFIMTDNASSDNTKQLMQGFLEKRTGRLIHEPKAGKSFALNAALQAARGDLIVFLDDDAIPVSGWLQAFRKAADRYPKGAVFVGQVRPCFSVPPPAWMQRLSDRGMSFAATPIALAEGPCDPGLVKGLNWACRASALNGVQFDELNNNLLAAGLRVGGQDTEMARRLCAGGKTAIFVPASLTGHIVRREEASMTAILERYRRIGRGVEAQRHKAHQSTLRLLVEIMTLVPAGTLAWLLCRRTDAAALLIRAAMRVGRLDMRWRK